MRPASSIRPKRSAYLLCRTNLPCYSRFEMDDYNGAHPHSVLRMCLQGSSFEPKFSSWVPGETGTRMPHHSQTQRSQPVVRRLAPSASPYLAMTGCHQIQVDVKLLKFEGEYGPSSDIIRRSMPPSAFGSRRLESAR